MLQCAAAVHAPGFGAASSISSTTFISHAGEKLIGEYVRKGLGKQHSRRTVKFATFAKTSSREGKRKVSQAGVLLYFSSLLSNVTPVEAITPEDIAIAFSKVQDVSQQVVGNTGTVYGIIKTFLEGILSILKPAVDAAVPYVQKATDAAVQVATPIASDVAMQADKILKDAGVDTTPVVEAAKSAAVIIGEAVGKTTKVLEDAKPIVSDSFESIVAADPLVLIGSAGVLILLYSIAPSVLSSVVYAARGYKGDLSAPQALDLLTRENYLLVDVRREREKSKSGVPSLPCNTRNKLLSLSVEELPGKLKSQLRDAKKVEAELAAVKISYLKKVNKGSRLVILDAYVCATYLRVWRHCKDYCEISNKVRFQKYMGDQQWV
eukprot:c27555_g1_i2 orf=469-1602(+)